MMGARLTEVFLEVMAVLTLIWLIGAGGLWLADAGESKNQEDLIFHVQTGQEEVTYVESSQLPPNTPCTVLTNGDIKCITHDGHQYLLVDKHVLRISAWDVHSCRTRLPRALAKARRHLPEHRVRVIGVNAVVDTCAADGECLARRRLAEVIEEKALVAEVDDLLRWCGEKGDQ